MLNGWGQRALYGGATMAVAVTADVATKSWAAARLSGGRDITTAGPLVQLRLVVNHGATLGLAASAEPLLAVIAAAGMLLLGAWALRARGTAERTGAALAAAGAAGNLIDRLFRAPAVLHGGVIDWIHLSFYGPTFNLADVWLRAGLVIAVIGWLWSRRAPAADAVRALSAGRGASLPDLFVVLGGVGGVGAARRRGPLHGAGLGLGEVPAGGVLGVVVTGAEGLLLVIITHVENCLRCLIYTRISKDQLGDGHGVANQLADLEKRALARGWTVVYRLSDNDIGVTRKDPTAAGKRRPGYEEALRLVNAGAVDVVFCWKWDRFIREPMDLEYLIPRFDKAGVRFAEADGIIDLGTDSGRLAARILIAVAKAEQERKSERQKLANEAAAIAGKRRLGTPRPFGYAEDRVTAHPAEGPAVAEACALLLGGGTLSAILRGWSAAGLSPPQSKAGTWTRSSIREILLNPRNAGLSAYHGEVVGAGMWEPLVGEETWRAVRGILQDPARKPPKGVRTLLGGLALCPCGNVVSGMPSHTGRHVYRCAPVTRDPAWPGGHVSRQSAPVEDFIVRLVIARLSRPDAADLLDVAEGGPDVTALREESAAIRRNLEELAADRAVGLIDRAQMLAATSRANGRLGEIGAELDSAARENVLAPLVAAENAAAVWEDLDLAVKRAVIRTLMTITLHSPGRGNRAFNPDTVAVDWRRQD